MSRYELGSAAEQTSVKWQHEALSQLVIHPTQRYPDTPSSGFHQIQQTQGIRLPTLPTYGNFQTNNATNALYRSGNFQQPQPQPGLITPPQQNHHDAQALLAHLNTSGVTPQQLSQFVAPQQPFMAPEEARLLEFRNLLPDWQTANHKNKLADWSNNAHIASWMQRQQLQHKQRQQQLYPQHMDSRKISDPSGLSPTALQLQASLGANSHTPAKYLPNHEQASPIPVSAFQQPGLLSPNHLGMDRKPSLDHNNMLLKAMNEQIQSAAQTSHQGLIAPKPVHGTSGFLSPQPERQNTTLERPSTVSGIINGAQQYSPSTTPDEPSSLMDPESARQPLLFATSDVHSSEEVGIKDAFDNSSEGRRSCIAVNGSFVSGESNEAKTKESADSEVDIEKDADYLGSTQQLPIAQPLMKSILDIDVEESKPALTGEGNSEENDSQSGFSMDCNDEERPTSVQSSNAERNETSPSNLLADFSSNSGSKRTTGDDKAVPPHGSPSHSDAIAPTHTTTAIRLDEPILGDSNLGIPAPATPVPNSSTNSTSSVISGVGSPPRSTPSSFPNSSASPQNSESVPTTPRSTFCRAPGLGPVSLLEGHPGPQHPLVCNICGFSCNSKFHYNSHMNTHGDHQCTMCDYTSRTEGRLKKHMRDSHTVEQQLAAGLEVDVETTPRSASPVTKPTTPVGLNLATSMASLLESANLAAAAQAAQKAGSQSPDTSPSSALNGSPDSADKSSCGLPAEEGSPGNSILPLDQMRALADNPGLISDLASTNLATALMSHGILSGKQALLDSVTSFQREEPSTSGVNGERRSCSGKPKTYKCKQCNHVSTSKEEQWIHARSHIPAEKRLECNRCGFVTEYKHHLEYHLRNHIGSKPFQCKKCAYACVNKSMLNSHMKSHTNVYQFRCRDCSYATKYCHSLKLHLKKYNHNRAGDINDGAALDASNEFGGSFDGLGDDNPMRRLSESYSLGGDEENSPSPQGSVQQSIANAIGLTQMVTPNSLNLSQLLLQQQQQAEQLDAVSTLNAVNAAIRMNALQSVSAGAVLPPHCQFCPYQPISVDDSLRHQMMHIITGQSDLSSSIAVPTAIHPNKSLMNGKGEEDKSVENNSFEDRDEMEENEQPTTTADDDENMLSDDTGRSEHRDSVESEKSSSDERSTPIDESSGKGARKRKAGLKLNQIAARLQEKQSPGADDSGTSFEPAEVKRERSNDSASSENTPTPLASALQISTPIASLPAARFLPALAQQPSNLALFQQVTNMQQHQLEERLRSILDLWKFSCGHCKMAFQDQALYQIHMGYHGYENPFKCNRCGQSCNDIMNFNLHLFEAKH